LFSALLPRSPRSTLFPYTTLFRSWSGHVPGSCRNRLVPVPVNWSFLLWGWPERFHARMQAHGSEVIIMGDYAAGDAGTSGIDDRSEEHTSELQSRENLVCRLLLEK